MMAHVSPCRYSHLLTLSTLGCGLDIGNDSKLNDRHTLLPPTRTPIYFHGFQTFFLSLNQLLAIASKPPFIRSKPLPSLANYHLAGGWQHKLHLVIHDLSSMYPLIIFSLSSLNSNSSMVVLIDGFSLKK